MSEIVRNDLSPDEVEFDIGHWGSRIKRYDDSKILASIGTGYGDLVSVESVADCDALIALATALKTEWRRLDSKR